MSRLRDEVRSAFEREQAALGDVGDARHRLMHGAMVNRDVPASRSWQWAAGVAAVLIAAIVITTFALVRSNTHSNVVPGASPSASSRPHVSPTPLTNPLAVPDSTPILVYRDPAKADQIDGITWDGKTSGTLPGASLGTPNPAENLFATSTEIRDRSGRVVATGTFGAKFFTGTWADDQLHFCQMVPFDAVGTSGLNTTLQLVSSDGKARKVAQIGSIGENTSITVAACSVLNDRAVVVQNNVIGTADKYWVLQLSTGQILWSHDMGSTNAASVIASRDGMYVAEAQSPNGPSGTTIYGPDGKQVAHSNLTVEAFSWDGSLAVVDLGYGTEPVKLISWRDGKVVWTAPSGYGLIQARAQPGGTEVAVLLIPGSQFSQESQTGNLYVLSASGKVVVHITPTP
jgi:hypothetical protein